MKKNKIVYGMMLALVMLALGMMVSGCPDSSSDDDDGYCCSPICGNPNGVINLGNYGPNMGLLFESAESVGCNADRTSCDLHFLCANYQQSANADITATLINDGYQWTIADVVVGPGACDPLCVPGL
jgi:hypothetical protein